MKRTSIGKPMYVEARTRAELMNKITKNYCQTYGGAGHRKSYSCLGSLFGATKSLRVYNIHKQRPKKSPDHKTQVREGKWYGYVYTIDMEMVKVVKSFKVEQHARHFDLFVEL